MIRKTKPASLLLLLHLMAAPPPRHEHKNDLYSRGLKVIIMVFKNIESRCPWREIACCHMFEKDTRPDGHMSPAGNPSCPEVSQAVDLLNHR